MSLESVTGIVKKFPDKDLSHFAKQISDQRMYDYFKDEEGMSQENMDKFIKFVTKELMRRNLVIPVGTGVDMMEIAEEMYDDPEFGDKYKGEGL